MPDIHKYLRRTYGPLRHPRLKVEKIEPRYEIVITNDPERVIAEMGELFASWEAWAKEEIRRRIEEE